jgi:stage II sporulation protein GA (sporulation sigma-E factor processing peptidase)
MFEDYLLLLCVKKILNLRLSYSRLALGCLCGGVLSLIVLLPNLNFLLNILIKIISTGILVLSAFGFKSRKLFLKTTLTLFILSFLLNGSLIFFYLAVKPQGMEIINDTVYFNISPVLLIILTLIIYFILYIYRKLFSNNVNSTQVHKVKIYYDNREIEFNCKRDSGCNIKEPFSGSDVIIVEEISLDNLTIPENRKRVIPFESLGGSGIIYGFRPDKVEIDDIVQDKEIYIGLCNNVIKSEIKGLIPENLLKG